jgi:hypothetical protein
LNTEELRAHFPKLIAGRLLLSTVAGSDAVAAAGISPVGWITAAEIREAVLAERDRLQRVHDAAAAAPGKSNLVSPDWPAIPDQLDIETACSDAGEPKATRALAIARHLGRLALTWQQLETERLTRKHLRIGAADAPRPLPLNTTGALIPAQPTGIAAPAATPA